MSLPRENGTTVVDVVAIVGLVGVVGSEVVEVVGECVTGAGVVVGIGVVEPGVACTVVGTFVPLVERRGGGGGRLQRVTRRRDLHVRGKVAELLGEVRGEVGSEVGGAVVISGSFV